MPKDKKFDALNATFNIDVKAEEVSSEIVPIEEEQVQKQEPETLPDLKRLESDISYVFAVLTQTIEKSKEALDGALELAQETDSSRAYEVVGQLVKQTVDSAEKIIDMHKKLKDIKQGKESVASNITTNNSVFIGTTAEALKLIKSQFNEISE
jgi:hypothetical protein